MSLGSRGCARIPSPTPPELRACLSRGDYVVRVALSVAVHRGLLACAAMLQRPQRRSSRPSGTLLISQRIDLDDRIVQPLREVDVITIPRSCNPGPRKWRAGCGTGVSCREWISTPGFLSATNRPCSSGLQAMRDLIGKADRGVLVCSPSHQPSPGRLSNTVFMTAGLSEPPRLTHGRLARGAARRPKNVGVLRVTAVVRTGFVVPGVAWVGARCEPGTARRTFRPAQREGLPPRLTAGGDRATAGRRTSGRPATCSKGLSGAFDCGKRVAAG